jgi:alkylhydroperoxidase family enzyme
VDKVYADWRTAPVRPQVRAALGFIEKLVRKTDELTRADAEEVLAAGVSREGLIRAVQICVAFSMIVRLADTFEFAIPDDFMPGAHGLMKRGYVLP